MTEPATPPPETLMAYLDGELTGEEARAFEQLLEQHPEWRQEAAKLGALVTATDKLAFRPPPAETWDNYWAEIDSRIAKPVGWLIMAFGGLILVCFGTFKILLFAENPWVRLGLAALLLGILITFMAVLRGHLLERPRDRYRRIQK